MLITVFYAMRDIHGDNYLTQAFLPTHGITSTGVVVRLFGESTLC